MAKIGGLSFPLNRCFFPVRQGLSRLAELCWLLLACLIGVGCTAQQSVQAAASGVPPTRAAAAVLRPQWIQVPRTSGRITAAQLGVVINTTDPYSVAVGEYYVLRRHIAPDHVLRLALPRHARLSVAELESLRRRIDEFFGDRVEALALAWVQPFAVECQSITGALALGFDPDLCRHTCARANLSRYHNAATERPWIDLGLRPSMLLAARSVEQARAMIDRGIAADHSLGLRGALPAQVYFLATSDAARSVRERVFPPAGLQPRLGIDVHVERTNAFRRHDRLLLVETGLARLTDLDTLGWVPGALADHLTSFGGVLDQTGGQTTALAWIESGATASYGTVSEPCNHLEKFPHPQKLLLHYVQGSSALEAYWKSVAWPQQGVFVGEPLAAPFARRVPSSPE
jgi:uncharacterized protein (TIGR03790 family)